MIEVLGLVPSDVTFTALEQFANLNPTHKILPEVTRADGIEALGSHPISKPNATQQSLLNFVNIG